MIYEGGAIPQLEGALVAPMSLMNRVMASKLSRDTPFLMRQVSATQLSISRHYGGCKFNGEHYTYLPLTDELIRDDVLKFVNKLRKSPKKAKHA